MASLSKGSWTDYNPKCNSKPEGAQSHALHSPYNLSGAPRRLPLQGGCKMSREIAPANHKTVAPRSKIRYTIKKENAL